MLYKYHLSTWLKSSSSEGRAGSVLPTPDSPSAPSWTPGLRIREDFDGIQSFISILKKNDCTNLFYIVYYQLAKKVDNYFLQWFIIHGSQSGPSEKTDPDPSLIKNQIRPNYPDPNTKLKLVLFYHKKHFWTKNTQGSHTKITKYKPSINIMKKSFVHAFSCCTCRAYTVCPRRLDLFYKVCYYIKWVKPS